MNILLKLWLFALTLILLASCSTTNTSLSSNVKDSSPKIYSTTVHILGSKRIILKSLDGKVTKIGNNKPLRLSPSINVVDPGVYKIEISWDSEVPPSDSNDVISSSTYLPMGSIVLTGKNYRPKNSFTLDLKVRDGYDYIVNLQEYTVNSESYRIPKRVCMSEIKKGSKEIRVAPAGNIIINKPVKTYVCSK